MDRTYTADDIYIEWARTGWDLHVAMEWVDAGFTLQRRHGHPELEREQRVAEIASEWEAAEWDHTDATHWWTSIDDPAAAQWWSRRGYTPEGLTQVLTALRLQRLHEDLAGEPSPAHQSTTLYDWGNTGLPARHISLAILAGLTPAEARHQAQTGLDEDGLTALANWRRVHAGAGSDPHKLGITNHPHQ